MNRPGSLIPGPRVDQGILRRDGPIGLLRLVRRRLDDLAALAVALGILAITAIYFSLRH